MHNTKVPLIPSGECSEVMRPQEKPAGSLQAEQIHESGIIAATPPRLGMPQVEPGINPSGPVLIRAPSARS